MEILSFPDDLDTDDISTITFTETGRNTNEFATDEVGPITLSEGADINSRVTASYAGEDVTLIVREESTDISITSSDDFWNSGEAATITVVAPDLNLDTMEDETLDQNSELVPTIKIGTPTTITDFDFYLEGDISHSDTEATAL